MCNSDISISKKTAYRFLIGSFVLVSLLLIGWRFSTSGFGSSYDASGADLAAGSSEKFAFLSGKGSQRSVGST